MTPTKEATDEIAAAMRALMALMLAQGHDRRHVLAAAHAVAISEICAAYGGEIAAERARAAAEAVETLPPAKDISWAAQTQGRPC